MNPFHLDPSLAWLPGTLFGVTAGFWGAVQGVARGFGWRRLDTAAIVAYFLLFSAASVLLQFGIVALATGRPSTLWVSYLLPGAIGTVQLSVLFPVVWLGWVRRARPGPPAA